MPKLKERWIDELMVTMGIVNCIDDLGCHAISSKLGCHRKVRAERVRKGTYEKGGIVGGETELRMIGKKIALCITYSVLRNLTAFELKHNNNQKHS